MQLRFLIISVIALIACISFLVTKWNITPQISRVERVIPYERFLDKRF